MCLCILVIILHIQKGKLFLLMFSETIHFYVFVCVLGYIVSEYAIFLILLRLGAPCFKKARASPCTSHLSPNRSLCLGAPLALKNYGVDHNYWPVRRVCCMQRWWKPGSLAIIKLCQISTSASLSAFSLDRSFMSLFTNPPLLVIGVLRCNLFMFPQPKIIIHG